MEKNNKSKNKKNKITKNQKIVLILLCILLLIILPISIFLIFSQDFQVKDFQENIELNIQEEFSDFSGNVCYGGLLKCENVNVTKEGEVDSTKVGDYEVTYKYTYKDKVLEKKQIVHVVDKESPVITISSENLSYCPNGKLRDYEVKALDNVDGDITNLIEIKAEEGKLYFSVRDSSSNETTEIRDALIEDKDKPVIILKGESTTYMKQNSSYTELGATATDYCDGDLTSEINITGTINTSKVGEQQVTYRVKDKSGNEASIVRKVYVYGNNDTYTPNGKSIYLTFDDGPGPYTEELLDILKKYNVKATFFVTNQGLTKGYDNLILRAYQEGHTIGLHTNTHNYNIYTNETTYFNDLYAIQDKVERITGMKSFIIRFPGGSSNTVSQSYDNGSHIMSKLTKAVEAKGFRYFDWNVSSGDAGETTNTNVVAKNVIQSLGNNSTYMVLQHDIKNFSVKAVSQIIEYGLSHGYTFRPITMETPNVHHHINN